MKAVRSCLVVLALFFNFQFAGSLSAQDNVRISEFMAVNDGPLADENGDFSDWIELHNAGTNTVNLDGWYLTDRATDLKRWRFPATNMAPNSYLLVWASNKDRRAPGAPLHTSFALNSDGEFLGLVKPDGVTVVSSYAPVYPPQVGRVSFGTPLQQATTMLLTSGAPARVFVPLNDALGNTWSAVGFDDSSWIAGPTGVGYETDGQAPFTPTLLADSVADFSGAQGSNNWQYGYWNKTADGNGSYSDAEFTAFPNAITPHGANNYFNGTNWDWFAGDPPFTQISAGGAFPSGNNGVPGRPEHWAIRRYLSETSGPVRISGRISQTSDWVRVSATGVAANSLIYVYLTGAGDGYIDDMKLVAGGTAEAGPNLLPNGDFETALTGPWTVSANHAPSSITTAVKRSGNSSLYIVATQGGSTQGSAIWQTIAPALTNGQTYTLSYWYLPGANPAPLVVRFSGNWISTAPAFCGDGVVGRIFVDGAEVFHQSVFVGSADYSLTVPVNVGSRIDFALDPGSLGNDLCDASEFTAKVETADPTILVVADSVADWSNAGTQGEKNWFYGYYNKTADTAVPGYQATNFTAFPRGNGPHGAANFWTGTAWDWFNGNPPWDEIGQTFMHPSGVNTGPDHWVIRRWASEVGGRIVVDWTIAKSSPGGNGVTGRVFHNGVQRDSAVIGGGDTAGLARSIVITNVEPGDFIDVALDSIGTDGAANDGSDGSTMTVVIRGAPSLAGGIATDIEGLMRNVNASAYIRVPFVVTNPTDVAYLTLRMKYDDGFFASLNGVGVASRNAPFLPDVLAWNSSATTSRLDADANQFEEIDLSAEVGLLRSGTNILAIHGLNAGSSDSDFLILPELRATSVAISPSTPLYFSVPTPGAPNGGGDTNLGPIVVNVGHEPAEPRDNENLYVTAQVIPTFNPISSVRLVYRVMFGSEVTVTMLDNGLNADGVAGDGIYGGVIPASASTPGQMVRYYVFATDSRTNGTRFPLYNNPANTPQYAGTVVLDPSLTNSLPVLHWFVQTPGAADTGGGTKGAIYFRGQFRDNISANLHGQSSSGFPKKSYDFDLNPGEGLRWSDDAPRVDDFNLLSTWADKSHMRNMLSYEAFHDIGSPYHFAFAVRVQQNGAFFSVANFVENGDDNFLQRLGLDENGALYKMYNTFTGAGDTTIGPGLAEKKTRKNEGNADLVAFLNGVTQTGQARINYLYDNVNIPEVISYLSGMVLVAHEDCCHKNYYFYRDTEGTGEWQMMPWDVDLTFGRTWTSQFNYFDTRIFATNFYSANSLNLGGGNGLVNAVFAVPAIYQMYLRRVRTVTDENLQSPATHPYLLKWERRIDELTAQIAPDAALDLARWSSWAPIQTQPQGADVIKFNYLDLRRPWIFNTLGFQNGGPYMAPQPTNALVNIGAIEFNPASGNQAQEYIQILNPNPYPVDMSGWRLAGAIDYTIRPGVVLPTNGVLYISPDVRAFRARTTGPRGGQGLFVQGNYQNQLSARGELVQLIDNTGRIVRSTNYTGAPSLPQQFLRVTEIMYSPAPQTGQAIDPQEFEYVELKNIGPVSLSLLGVRFVNGIEFAFTGSAVTSLAAGETVLVVRNTNAFTLRYGAGQRIAGQFAGALDNKGENLRLDDASNEKILDFDYNQTWYPITDGLGFSLVIVNENAAWNTWSLKESWRPSGRFLGSPGTNDPAPPVIAPILVNELLTHTDLPQVDAIELWNPTASAVDVGGWFISDDFTNATKFRIPNGTTIPAGGYRVFTEAEFNPAGAGFAFSSKGDEAYLFSGDPAGTNLTGYLHGFNVGAAENGVTFGRHITSLGETHFVAQSANTLTNANASPKVGPIVITEIMFRPPDLPGGADNSEDEFIELRNITGTNVPLYHAAFPTNRWRVRGGVDYDFPANATLNADSSLLLVNFQSTNVAKIAAFRAKYGVPGGVAVFGPYDGKLDNSADTVRLSKPDAPDAGEAAPYILVDEVDYRDTTPWPVGADGTGASLQRVSLAQYGNDPIIWTAGAPSAGADFGGGTAPAITSQPTNLIVATFSPATFSLAATGTAPLRYQWRRNGANIPGATNSIYSIASVPPLENAIYSAAVFNSAGTAISSNATLLSVAAAAILQQPQSRSAFPGASVSFTVGAGSTTPLSYQWRRNETNLPGATAATYTISSVQAGDAGVYTVAVSDAIGTILSQPATLSVILHPIITAGPSNRVVNLIGSPVSTSFSVTAQSGTLLRYQWLFNGNLIPNGTSVTLTLNNVQPTNAGLYSVIVSDNFGSTNSLAATLTVNAQATVTQQPLSISVPEGGTAALSIAATGTEPIGFRWRASGGTISLGHLVVASGFGTIPLNLTSNAYVATGYIANTPTSSVLVLTNVRASAAGTYNVVVTNVARQFASANATLIVLPDTDRDGLPDEWETGRAGFSINDPADGARDDDSDGVSNAAEYFAGTDYLDSNSKLRQDLTRIDPVTLSFLAASNRTYTIQFTERLNPASWSKLADLVARTNARIESVTDPAAGTNRFYRTVTPVRP